MTAAVLIPTASVREPIFAANAATGEISSSICLLGKEKIYVKQKVMKIIFMENYTGIIIGFARKCSAFVLRIVLIFL